MGTKVCGVKIRWAWRLSGHVWRSGGHEGQTRTFHLEQPVQTAIFS